MGIAAFEEAERDDSVLAVVFTGEGRFFCSGADVAGNPETYDTPDPPRVVQIKEVLSKMGDFDSNTFSDVNMYDAWINFSKPLVMAVNGPAIGEGFTTLMMGDIIYAADSAYFWAPFARFGVVPEIGSTVRLKALRIFKSMLKTKEWREKMLAQNRNEQEIVRQRVRDGDMQKNLKF